MTKLISIGKKTLNTLKLKVKTIDMEEAIVKKTGKHIVVESVPEYVDKMTFYFVYVDVETKEKYRYNELKFKD